MNFNWQKIKKPIYWFKKSSKRILLLIILGVFFIGAGIFTIIAVSNRGDDPFIYLEFDEGHGATTYDSSGNDNNGTINNAAWKSEEECLSGRCLYFDGDGDYVSIPDFDLE